MGQSIAVLIGNTRYDELPNLECCANDVDQVHELLTDTQKFSQILKFVDAPVTALKDQLRRLTELDDSFEEFFIYFSGHGLSNNDDFYMCFEAFKETSPNTTGLSRSDAFDLVRQLDAELSVVVIDACEAGRNLIKNDITPLARTLKSGFTNFVQISSCTESQNSIAGDNISLFTGEFIKACLQKEQGVVYYSDVENALRDAFLGHPSQTPHFIRQSTSQEKFCNDASYLDEFRKKFSTIADDDKGREVSAPLLTAFSMAKAAIEGVEARVPSKEDDRVPRRGVASAVAVPSGQSREWISLRLAG